MTILNFSIILLLIVLIAVVAIGVYQNTQNKIPLSQNHLVILDSPVLDSNGYVIPFHFNTHIATSQEEKLYGMTRGAIRK